MAESSSAQDTEQAPESSNQPQQDERNDEVAGDESAMLLPQDDAPPSSPPPAGLSPPKAIHALTPLAISFSVSSLVFLIAAEITLAVLSRTNFRIGWQVQEPLKQLIAPTIVSVLISAYNLTRLRRGLTPTPLFINLIVDILIAIFAIVAGASGLSGMDDAYCWYYDRSCMLHGLPARIFAGIAFSSAIIFGTIHLALFVTRCIVAYRRKFWQGPWGFPDGQLTVELSLKLFKEPQKPREVGADAV